MTSIYTELKQINALDYQCKSNKESPQLKINLSLKVYKNHRIIES